jgi:hypothetical protein
MSFSPRLIPTKVTVSTPNSMAGIYEYPSIFPATLCATYADIPIEVTLTVIPKSYP